MKAAVIHEFGDVDVLKVEDVQTPKPRQGHVLVKVLAAGVNRLDDYIRGGSVVPELSFPHLLGADAAGEVFELGRGVTGLEVGERVIVAPGYPTDDAEKDIRPTVTAPSFALPGLHIDGTYAQYIEVPARAVVKDDTGLSPEEAATLPVVLATAVHALKGVGGIKAGDKVLIHAGASGSGSMQIQVAKALGAEVATTVRDDAKGEFAEQAGADLVINARTEDIVERVIVVPGFPLDDAEADIRPTVTAPSFALPGLHITGTYAQYIEVPARAVVKDETGLSPEEVATLPVVLATAVHAVKGVGGVVAGDKVLIHAGASGSGSMQIQVAKALGTEVATTVRDDAKGAFAKEAGADLVINSKNDDIVERVKEWTGGQGADVVIDNLAGDVLAKSIEAAKAQGVVVAFGFTAGPEVSFDIRSLFFAQKQVKGSMASDIEDLEWGLEQVRVGRIKPLLDRTLPLSQAGAAHKLLAEGHVKGNVVLQPWAE